MTQRHQGDDHGRRRPTGAVLHPSCCQTNGDQRETQRQRERELAGQRRCNVAAVDGEVRVEQEHGRTQGHEAGQGLRRTGETTHRISRKWKEHQAGDRHQLEGDPVGQSDHQDRHQAGHGPGECPMLGPTARRCEGTTESNQRHGHAEEGVEAGIHREDRQRRHHHVEVVGGEPGVPVRGPARQPARGQQVVPHVGGPPHVGAHVATRWRRVGYQEIRPQLQEHEDRTHHGDRQADEARSSRQLAEKPEDGRGATRLRPLRFLHQPVVCSDRQLVGLFAQHDPLMVPPRRHRTWAPTAFSSNKATVAPSRRSATTTGVFADLGQRLGQRDRLPTLAPHTRVALLAGRHLHVSVVDQHGDDDEFATAGRAFLGLGCRHDSPSEVRPRR